MVCYGVVKVANCIYMSCIASQAVRSITTLFKSLELPTEDMEVKFRISHDPKKLFSHSWPWCHLDKRLSNGVKDGQHHFWREQVLIISDTVSYHELQTGCQLLVVNVNLVLGAGNFMTCYGAMPHFHDSPEIMMLQEHGAEDVVHVTFSL